MKVIAKIARDSVAAHEGEPPPVQIEGHRSLAPVLRELRQQGFQLVGLEQTTGSHNLYDFRFQRKSVLVVGNERLGLAEDVLQLVDAVVEIPVYGQPYSHNAATAASIGLYEYCRQFPEG